jgi:hypothetical protein
MSTEVWEADDIVMDADGALWLRGDRDQHQHDWDWSYVSSYTYIRGPLGFVGDEVPVRPLTLLVRDGAPYAECASGGTQDRARSGPKPAAGRVPCPLCGKPTAIHATGKMFAHSDPKAATGALPCVGSGLTVGQAVPGLTRDEADEIRYGEFRRSLRR